MVDRHNDKGGSTRGSGAAHQAAPRLVWSNSERPRTLELCSSSSLTPSETRGSLTSLTRRLSLEGVSPTADASCRQDMPPFPVNSLRILGQSVEGSGSSLTDDMLIRRTVPFPVQSRQPIPAHGLRSVPFLRSETGQDPSMDRDLGHLATVGERVKFWRTERRYTVRQLANLAKIPASTLGGLERGATTKGKALPEIARALKISYSYLLTGKGDPEGKEDPLLMEREPSPDAWPLPGIPRAAIDDLTEIERGYLESQLVLLLDKIRNARRRSG